VSVPGQRQSQFSNDLKLWGRKCNHRALWESQLIFGDPAVLATTFVSDAGFNGVLSPPW
jgi:hypothetical protein